jgi:integrase
MASIWKDPRTRYWVACFTDRNGRRVKRSTGETLPKKAQKIADEYEKVARTKQTVRTVRSTISSLAQEIWGVAVTTQSLREHIHAWLEEKRSDAAASTIEFYEKSAAKFLGFLGPAADEPIDQLEKEHVRKFKAEISKTLAAKTVNHHLKLLRMVFRAARRDGLIDDDPAEFVDTIKREKRSVRRAFTVEEIGRVLKCCEGEWRSIVICGLYTGQRLADLACLRWSNVDLDKKVVTLITRKTDRKLTIPIAPAFMSHLKTLPFAADRNTPVHPQAAAVVGKQGRVGTLSNQFSAILVKAGFRDASSLKKQGTGKGRQAKRELNELSFHSLRHTAVTLLKEAGIPAAVVMEMIGHDSEQMSEHYTHVGSEALKKAADSLPDVTSH